MTTITYDKDGNAIPSREFLNIMIIVLRKAEQETGGSFITWLESFKKANVNIINNQELRAAIHDLADENYPDLPSL